MTAGLPCEEFAEGEFALLELNSVRVWRATAVSKLLEQNLAYYFKGHQHESTR